MNSPKHSLRSVACIGEVMVELSPEAPECFKAGVAGDTFNTAVYLVRELKNNSVKVSYVTALGADLFSDRILAEIKQHGLATDHIERRPDHMPGLYAIHTNGSGERSFSYWRETAAARTLFSEPCEVELDHMSSFDLVFLSGITMAILPPPVRKAVIDWAEGFRNAGGTLVYDNNYRARLWEDIATAREINLAMWSLANIALPSLEDEMELFGDVDRMAVVDRLHDAGATRGILKCGADGPLDLSTGLEIKVPPREGPVIDSTAAGDSFNAGFLASHIAGHSDVLSAKAGHALAAYVIGFPGAIVPSRD